MLNTATITSPDRMLGGLWGSLVGDALGVPVEFRDRARLRANPVTDMRGYGTHNQPPGTWSDDGALLLCTVDSLLATEFDLEDMGRRFVQWVRNGLWAAHGEAFDVGVATSDALHRIEQGTLAEQAGGQNEHDNGNGSLMRILPVALRFADRPIDELADRVARASAITHAHTRSRLTCVLHALVVRHLLIGLQPDEALQAARTEFIRHFGKAAELARFDGVLNDEFTNTPEDLVVSTGYVLHTLHASLWCLLNSASYEECVLKAVNLGGDTDTTGCVAGGLAGVLYGVDAIPPHWRAALARRKELEALFGRFSGLPANQT